MAPSIKDVLIDVTDGRRGAVNPQMIIAIGFKVDNERVVQRIECRLPRARPCAIILLVRAAPRRAREPPDNFRHTPLDTPTNEPLANC